jgi:hypothetical protein
LLKNRIRLFFQGASMWRSLIHDKDNEVISSITRPAGGYDTITEKTLEFLLMNCDLLASEVLGQNLKPSGLSDPGVSELQIKNQRTLRYQKKFFHSNIRQLLRLVFLSKKGLTKGKIPKGWGWKWHPWQQPTAVEQAELQEKYGQLLTALNGIDPRLAKAAAISMWGGKEFSPVINLPPALVKQIEAEVIKPPQTEPDVSALEGGEPAPDTEEPAPDELDALNTLDEGQ